MTTLSLRTRLTLWYTLALVAVLGLFGADVLWIQSRIGTRRVDRELNGLTTTIENVIREEWKDDVSLASVAEEARRTVSATRHTMAIFDGQGAPLAATWSGLELHAWTRPRPGEQMVWNEQTPSGAWRIHARSHSFDAATLILLVASPLADVHREQHEVQEAMLVGIPIALLLAAAGGLWLASIGLRPISDMARQAALISLTGTEELGPTGRADELGLFARAFNSLVARLRTSLQTQRQFMADASHELRTPVSVVRSASDIALSREHRSEEEYREALSLVADQSRRLGRLVDDMLVLARADAGGYPLRPVDLYLDEVIVQCCRAVEVLATERGVAIRLAPLTEVPLKGDEDLLRQLFLNLLQNAVHHTPPGGSVRVEISLKNSLQVRITNTGPGIPAADQTRIFDRFVRLDSARSGPGAGLGLPIARWIAEVHEGTLVLEASGPDGTTFCVTLPRNEFVPRDDRDGKNG